MKTGLRPLYGFILVILSLIILAIFWGVFYSFGIFFEPLRNNFGWNRALTSGAFSFSLLVVGALGLVAGKVSDRHGSRAIITVGGLLFGLGYILMSQINALWQFYLIYIALIGVGVSCTVVPITAMLSRWFLARRGLIIGIVVSGFGLGMLIMPLIANSLIAAYDWRISYLIVGIAVLVLITIAAQFLRRDPRQMGLLAYGEKKISHENYDVQLSGFFLSEAIRTKAFWLFAGAELCFGFFLYIVLVHITPYAIGLGISPTNAAGIVAIIGGFSISGRVLMGIVGDRLSSRVAFIISFAFMAAGLVLLPFAGNIALLYVFALIFGFGYGGESPLRPQIVADVFGLKSHGVIHASVFLGFSIGGTIGPILAGRIYDFTDSYFNAFIIGLIVGIVGLVLTFILRTIYSGISYIQPAKNQNKT